MSKSPRFLVTFLSVLFGTAFAAAPDPGSPCRSRGLAFDDKSVAWTHVPLSKLKRDTVYRVVHEGDRVGVLRATADTVGFAFCGGVEAFAAPAHDPQLGDGRPMR